MNKTPYIYTAPAPKHTHQPRKHGISYPLKGCGIAGSRKYRKVKKMSR